MAKKKSPNRRRPDPYDVVLRRFRTLLALQRLVGERLQVEMATLARLRNVP